MSRLNHEPDVIAVAMDLGLPLDDFPADRIVQYCLDRISSWIGPKLASLSIEEIEASVCRRLRLRIVEVYCDDDIQALSEEYISQREFVFASLAADLDEKTFANVIKLNRRDGTTGVRYVAVIDCRTRQKATRAFFSRWHEIAHLISASKKSRAKMHFPVHRSFANLDPKERLMDRIAAKLAFHPTLFKPVLSQEVRQNNGRLTLGVVRAIQQRHSSRASFQSTFKACVSHLGYPAVYVEAGMGYKDGEAVLLQSGHPVRPAPVPQFRVLVVSPNKASHGVLRVDRNIRVPACSVLSKLFNASFTGNEPLERDEIENLSSWRHSSGRSLPPARVAIAAKRHGERIFAVMQLVPNDASQYHAL